jgi:crossover junction endodeoxyribonuclease RusA
MEVGRPDKRKRDIDNLLKPVLDALQMSGVIQDDHYAQSVFAQWVPELVGIRVTITPAE